MKRNKKNYKCVIILVIFIVLASTPFLINAYVVEVSSDYIISTEETSDIGADCILIPGAGLKPDGTPNHMLQDRLDQGIFLYKNGVAPKLLLSGDNGQEHYDEVNAMKEYALAAGVPPEDIFMDHAGFSTYESVYRAVSIFDVNTAIIVSQKYHLYRALYNSRELGLEAYGVVSEPRIYAGHRYREFREILARNKDFAMMLIKPPPKFLGPSIPISGSGLESHD